MERVASWRVVFLGIVLFSCLSILFGGWLLGIWGFLCVIFDILENGGERKGKGGKVVDG